MIASIGFVAGEASSPVPNINGMALSKGATLRGILIGNRDQFEDMNAHLESNNIKPLVDRVFPFAELKQGYEYLASQKVRPRSLEIDETQLIVIFARSTLERSSSKSRNSQ